MIEIILSSIIAFLLLFISFMFIIYSKIVKELTDKIMSKDYKEYSIYKNKKIETSIDTKKKESINDPVLGSNY